MIMFLIINIINFLLPLTSADFMMDKLESWVTITSVKLNFADDIGSNEMLLTADDTEIGAIVFF